MNSRVDGEGGEELRPGDRRWNHRLKTVIVPGSAKDHHNILYVNPRVMEILCKRTAWDKEHECFL